MLKEFKDFIARGNVIDLAVAVIMGGAFGPIVNSAVSDIIMPPIGVTSEREGAPHECRALPGLPGCRRARARGHRAQRGVQAL